MPYYELSKDGKHVNDIIGPLDVVTFYASQHGYTFREVEPPPPPEITEPEEAAPTEVEQLRADVDFLAAMQGVTL